MENYTEVRKISIKPDAASKTPQTENKEEENKQTEYQYEEKTINKTRTTQIHFKLEHHGYGSKKIDAFVEIEDKLCKEDKLIWETKIMRNQLETYVYDMRAALDTNGNLQPYMKDREREDFLTLLTQVECWIYDEGESAAKEVYHQKLNNLKQIGEPIKLRQRFHEVFPHKVKEFENAIRATTKQVSSLSESNSILTKDKKDIIRLCEECKDWITEASELYSSQKLSEDPLVDLVELDQKKHKLQEWWNDSLGKSAAMEQSKQKPKEMKM